MKILVTGGAGFIGSKLSLELINCGYDVTVFDNFSNSRDEIIQNLQKNGIKLIEGDITNYSKLQDSLSDIDTVVHLAAQINVNDSISDPEKTFLINVQGTKNVLDACIKNDVHNFVAASSAAVYGYSEKFPLDENSPLNPISPYGESKIRMEKLIQDYAERYNLNGISLRFFNIYGSRHGGIISKFLDCIENDSPLIIFGDGTTTRDFIHVQDIIRAIICSINNIKDKKGNCFNIATGNSITLFNLAKLMILLSGKNLKINFESPIKGDIHRSETNVNLAKSELNFSAGMNLKDGLQLFMNKKTK